MESNRLENFKKDFEVLTNITLESVELLSNKLSEIFSSKPHLLSKEEYNELSKISNVPINEVKAFIRLIRFFLNTAIENDFNIDKSIDVVKTVARKEKGENVEELLRKFEVALKLTFEVRENIAFPIQRNNILQCINLSFVDSIINEVIPIYSLLDKQKFFAFENIIRLVFAMEGENGDTFTEIVIDSYELDYLIENLIGIKEKIKNLNSKFDDLLLNEVK